MPMVAAIGMGVALIFGVLSLLLPLVLKFLALPVMLAGLAAAALAFYFGDELQWLDVMWRSRDEDNRLTSGVFFFETGDGQMIEAKQYPDLYTWSHPYGESVICHQDGACSVSIGWDGIDSEMLTAGETAAKWSEIYTLIGLLGQAYCAEFHFWREWDESLAAEYLEHSSKIIRGREIAEAVREAMADHLAPYGMSNRVALVLTRMPPQRSFMSFFRGGARRELLQQGDTADELLLSAKTLARKLPGGRIHSYTEYVQDMVQSYDRARFLRGHAARIEERFLISEQILSEAPRRDGKQMRVGDMHTKVLLVDMYPEAQPGWFAGLAALSMPLHVTQIIIPVDTRQTLRASERASDLAEGTQGKKGRSEKQKTINDLAGFQHFVAENNLGLFKNAYLSHLHGTPDELDVNERAVTDWIASAGGQVKAADYFQLPYFRAGQPGQGYRCPKFRTDHTWQIGNMAPVQVYRSGERNPESLRLGASGALIGFSTSTQVVPHSFTVAITGGGKGVEKVAQIAETYPFGIDWYIAEIGGSYKWIVESFGGVYSKIDPSETVVNPLPPYNVADIGNSRPLDAKLAGGTINALSFLLTDGKTELSIHQAAAAQGALQMLYAAPPKGKEAPTLADFLVELESGAKDLASEPQRRAAQEMTQNLNSFLETTEGRIFTRPDNLVLSEGITGVDLKEVDRASPKLLKFYLVFLALRFNHLAFARRNPARVLLDEMHKFVAIAPDVVGKLISELARMGRKDAAAIDLVTQGVAEIDIIEAEVLNSMPQRTLLYRSDGWEAIANRIAMPAGPLAIWKQYPYPLNFDYRPALKCVGQDYYNLHLTFPNLLLDLSATSPEDLDLKDRIAAAVSDPLERLRLFRQEKENRK